MIIGTAHFVSINHANLYYAVYGYDSNDVREKINEGEIHIGKPIIKENETLLIDNDGRYKIQTA